MKKTSDNRRSFPLRDRFQYWFDNRIAKGSLSLIHTLVVVCVVFAVLLSFLIILFRFNEEGQVGSVIWNGIANMINAWMPSFEDGSPGYVMIMALIAVIGVLFTSVLIGLVNSAIEEKVLDLKRGNSLVLEEGHIVVLGYYPGEYTLINQLILAATDKPACLVIGGDMERDEMEQDLKENVEWPGNFRIVCRKVDITDPSSIEKCSVESCRTVIISPTDDFTTVKAVLAVSALLNRLKVTGVQVNAILSRNENRLPSSLVETHNITTLKTNNIIAKMLAHSCTQTGLSETFREIFNFEGSEFYIMDLPETAGLSFEDVMTRMDKGIPVGIFREDLLTLNPPAGTEIREGDQFLVFAEESDQAKLTSEAAETGDQYIPAEADYSEKETGVVIFGYNETLPIVLRELPEHVNKVSLIGQNLEQKMSDRVARIAEERGFQLNVYPEEPEEDEALFGIASFTEHIIILSRHDIDPEVADMQVICLLLRLRDIREQNHLSYNITVEMQKEYNQKLVSGGDHTDFLVSSSMSSLFLAQLAESPKLISVFREILSNKGNELYLKNVGDIRMEGTWSIRELRRTILKRGYILLGYLDSDHNSYFNPDIDEQVRLEKDFSVIVLGEE